MIVAFLSAAGVAPVYADLPHDFELDTLPAVDLQSVGPARREAGLNVLGVDYVDIDVDYYCSARDFRVGLAMPRALQLRRFLARLNRGGVRAIEVSRPVRRPDRNPNVRRLSMTMTVAVPA